jgi:hypothetical protein
MWAEWSHATGGAVAPEDDPRWVCVLDVDLRVLDLRDPAVQRALRVSLAQLTGDWAPDAPNSATLRVAAAVRELGVDAAIVPSAARDGGWNLAVRPEAFERVRLTRRRREVPSVSPPAERSG